MKDPIVCTLMHEYTQDHGWETVPVFLNDEYLYTHLVPCADMRRHQLDPTCWCKPIIDDDEPTMVIHNSADGREAYEQGKLPS